MNKRLTLSTVILLAALIVSGCGLQIVQGSGKVVTETRTVDTFSNIKLSGIGDVIITQADETSVRIEAEDNLISYFETSVVGDTLTIGVKNQYLGISIFPTRGVKFYVSTPNVNVVTLAGSGNIYTGNIETTNFKASLLGSGNITNDNLVATSVEINLSGSGNVTLANVKAEKITSTIAGSGNITVAGEVNDQNAKIVGSGDYRAAELTSESATINVTGSGNSRVSVANTLYVTILGSGDVTYSGTPSVNTSIAGSGHVRSDN